MGVYERWSGEYEYDIDVLPLVPPMSMETATRR
jgi:hypothetical protein